MSSELLDWLRVATLASSAAIVLVLLLRSGWRRAFGATATGWLWALVPAVLVAVSLPARTEVVALGRVAGTQAAAAVTAAPVASTGIDPAVMLGWLLPLWLAGVAAMAIRLFAQQQLFRRLAQPLVARGDGSFRAARNDVGPAVLGLLAPRIVLPADFERRYTPEQQALVLEHERSHIRRGDLQANALASTLRCLFWFNPLVHVAAARLRFDQELAADAAVLARHPRARRSYADAMLNTQLADLGLPAGCYWQSSHPLKTRIVMLTLQTHHRRTRVGLALACALAGITATAAWAAQPPRLAAQDIAAAEQDGDHGASYRRLSPPKYPQDAIARRQQGVVLLEVEVAADGTPSFISVDDTRTPPTGELKKVLSDAAIAAVENWRFNPAVRDGQPVASTVWVPLEFRLSQQTPSLWQGRKLPDGALDAIYVIAAQDEVAAATVESTDAQTDATLLRTLPPKYPKQAIDERQSGKVVLKVHVNADGSVAEALVDSGDAPERLQQAALDAARGWTFNPAIKDGKAVDGWMLVPVEFRLDDDENNNDKQS